MTREDEIKREIREKVLTVKDELKGYKVFLFGSRASGRARERSDFDVGVMGNKPLPSTTFFKIHQLLDGVETLCRIELVDFNRVSPRFREIAMRQIEVLYDS